LDLDDKISEFVNKFLIRLSFLFFFLVLICQGIIYYQPYGLQIGLVDKLEGEPIKFEEVYPSGNVALEVKNMTLKVINPYISSLPEVKIFCNGKQVGDFTNLQFSLLTEIGDRITIDASKYSLDLAIRVIPSEGVKIKDEVLRIKKSGKITVLVEEGS